ncbi:ATP-dependent RNA helicase DeaD [Scopulibacillus darangshiensis]|uniref:ATP-dependent RNA helicase CshA n=1 Tax=Scopulibacillus darangshiensis TaxID=442528 RepID=A0A4V2SME9_9BACL|nr:DEAD/DEAH box helicase [Scopulibacillus darangshiensis]TCP27046.1 ATP-dependent RNA helicase DeaD [Scopulibacillus darangshiensis]
MKFSELTISDAIFKATEKMGFDDMTPIQEKAIPLALSGVDLIGQAQTGTGKTAAFGVPLVEAADPMNKDVQGIIIAPTRELAIQVADELNALGRYKKVVTLPVYGGQDIQKQIRSLKKRPSIISATPGRLLDHIKRRTIRLDNIKQVVLDEADEMLNMGFIDDIRAVLEKTPSERQTLLFSATMPKPIRLLAEQFMKNPDRVKIQAKTLTVDMIDQSFVKVREREKFDVLTRFLDIHSPERAIVFGRTKRRVDELHEALQKRGYTAEGIHGDLTQAKRDQVLRRFKNDQVDLLVATDVAARGLDISNVTHVYNFDLPQDPESYVHRIGRTGRAGKTGLALTFITPSEMPHLKAIEAVTKQRMKEEKAPTYQEALVGQQKAAMQSITDTLASGNMDNYKKMAENLLDENESVDLIAAALKVLTKEPDTTPVKLTYESPLMAKRDKRRPPRGKGRGGYHHRQDGHNRNDRYKGNRNRKRVHHN